MDAKNLGKEGTAETIKVRPFGTIGDRNISLYTLTNSNGVTMKVTNYGAIVTSLRVPDRSGAMDDIVLGFDDLQGYVRNNFYIGCIAGRFCGRIAKGQFAIEGNRYTLATNNGVNNLHGGIKGFDKRVWEAKEIRDKNGCGLVLTYESHDGEEGFPGKLVATVRYTLTNNNEVHIGYTASTDKTTVINLTNHAYFNLAGAGNGDILSHEIFINADRFLPVDATQIPTGALQSVERTPFDFRKPTPIGRRINEPDDQLRIGGGYDHTWAINKKNGLSLAATATDPVSRRTLEVFTTEPGVHLYSGNYLVDTLVGKNGKTYGVRSGFCLETQHFPDSPNKPEFPTVVVRPGELFSSTTIFKFSVT
jgi:aldose 1-epimerase